MRILRDYSGLPIRLTKERLAHILEHPEMAGMEQAIEQLSCIPSKLWSPSVIRRRGYNTAFASGRWWATSICV